MVTSHFAPVGSLLDYHVYSTTENLAGERVDPIGFLFDITEGRLYLFDGPIRLVIFTYRLSDSMFKLIEN